VQSSPDKTTRHAQIYVGDNQVRLEYQQDGQQMVEIYDMKNQRALLLMPQQRSYMERKLPAGGIGNPMLPPEETSPCAMLPKAQCKELARETLYGRPVVKWEMVVTQDDQPLRSLHWIDAERNMPLRQTFPDGTTSEMHLVGQESLGGRATERWELTTTRSDKEAMTSTQWYDPQLKIAIREELPGIRGYRLVQPDWEPYRTDYDAAPAASVEHRDRLLYLLKNYFRHAHLETDWKTVVDIPPERLVNTLTTLLPLDGLEKQAILEAVSAQERVDTLITALEMQVHEAHGTPQH
jgi:hypothetical protein